MSLHSDLQPFTRGHHCARFLLDAPRGLVRVYSAALTSTYITHHTLWHSLHTVLHAFILFCCLVFEILLYPPLSVHRGFPYCLIDSLSGVFILSHVYIRHLTYLLCHLSVSVQTSPISWYSSSTTVNNPRSHLQLNFIQCVSVNPKLNLYPHPLW